MRDIQKIVGASVRRARQAAGLNQEELADRAGIDRTYVSGVERGVRNPTIKVMAQLAAALDTTPALLMTPDAEFASKQATKTPP